MNDTHALCVEARPELGGVFHPFPAAQFCKLGQQRFLTFPPRRLPFAFPGRPFSSHDRRLVPQPDAVFLVFRPPLGLFRSLAASLPVPSFLRLHGVPHVRLDPTGFSLRPIGYSRRHRLRRQPLRVCQLSSRQ